MDRNGRNEHRDLLRNIAAIQNQQGDPWSSGTIRQYNPLSGPCCWTLHEEDSL
jgi:hypothetical protein